MKKMLVDISMTILIVLLMCLTITGLHIHELLGVAILFLFIIHNLLNYKWIKAITINFKKANSKTKTMYVLFVLLVITTLVTIITGLLINKTLLSSISITDGGYITILHKVCAYWSLILISVHIGIHLKTMLDKMSKVLKISKENKLIGIILKIIYVAISLYAIFVMITTNFFSKLNPFEGSGDDFDRENKRLNTNSTINDDEKNSTNSITTKTTKKKNTNVVTTSNSSSSTTATTLDDYLSNLHCTGCGRHCLLSSPRCNIGVEQAKVAQEEFNSQSSNSNSSKSESSNTLDSEVSGSSTINSDENSNNKDVREKKEFSEIENENGLISENKSELLNDVTIMTFLIGGTYYVTEFIEKNKKIKKKQ